jgi:quercetin dioxygenase-like cupin family protein
VLYRIPAGCSVPIHAGPGYALCQIITGRGKLVLPSDREIDYCAPELYIFEPGALHGWSDVVEDTLLTVCEVKAEDS